MITMIKFEKIVIRIVSVSNWIAAASIVFIMLLTTLEVVLRIFRQSIKGCYELVGLVSVLVISLSLGYTSLQRGHIAVEILVRRFSTAKRRVIRLINCGMSFALVAVLAWQSFLYAMHLREVGEVSPTLQIHIHPFVLGLTFGAILLCLVLIVEAMRVIRGADIE